MGNEITPPPQDGDTSRNFDFMNVSMEDDGDLGGGKGPIFEENEYEEIHQSPIATAFYAIEKEMKEQRGKGKSKSGSIPKTTKYA